jgi:hypothetical protein
MVRPVLLTIGILCFAVFTAPIAPALALSRPDAHAPIGVMGDHTHHKNELMLSYRYMRMGMFGNRDGTTHLNSGEVLRRYPVTPTRMFMDMHMVGVMYAPFDRLTLMGTVPLVRLEMDHATRMGRKFTTRSNGIGDIRLTALYRFFDSDRHTLHLNAGISFPTGDVEPRDTTPMGRAILPYPMRLGSGTYDLIPGLTYTGRTEDYSWGAQGLMTIRTGRNDRHYRLGHTYSATGWFARRWSGWVSTGVRLDWKMWNDISGADKRLMPMLVPTANPGIRGGSRLDGGLSLNILFPRTSLKGNRLAVEYLFPLYQSLDGPQLETDSRLIAGWQYSF